ncbi:MAG: prohibitin family protein [Opitutaceae bacterium]|nr:prohibitin family protein [Cytophagales bacterium]
MLFIFLGFIVLIASFALNRNTEFYHKFGNVFKVAGVILIIVGGLSSSIKQIDAGEVGVPSLFGKVDDRIMESGLNFVNPLVNVTKFDTKTQNYTMSSIRDEGQQSGDDAIRVLSADGLEVVIDLTVLYKIYPDKAPQILRQIGTDYTSIIVRPISRTKIRDNAVFYDAVALYSTKRAEFQDRIFKDIEADFKARGIVLEQLLIRNINLPESVKLSIESKINAEQESQKMKFVLDKEKQEADRKRVEAQGIADYQKILSTGLSDKQLQYELIKAQKEIATSQNAKVIILGGGKGTPVILSTEK